MIKYEELPKTLNTTKKEFEKIKNFYFAKSKEKISFEKDDDSKELKELEDFCVFFGLLQEFYTYLMKHEEEISIHIKDLMDNLNKHTVYLSKYGKCLEWDEEARWFYFRDMNSKDVYLSMKENNEEFLKNRKK